MAGCVRLNIPLFPQCVAEYRVRLGVGWTLVLSSRAPSSDQQQHTSRWRSTYGQMLDSITESTMLSYRQTADDSVQQRWPGGFQPCLWPTKAPVTLRDGRQASRHPSDASTTNFCDNCRHNITALRRDEQPWLSGLGDGLAPGEPEFNICWHTYESFMAAGRASSQNAPVHQVLGTLVQDLEQGSQRH